MSEHVMETPGAAATPTAAAPDSEHKEHASVGFYWMIGLVLTVITLAEVALFYIPNMGAALTPTLLIMSAVKFALVVMFFMHLKFDSKIFSGVFLAGLVLAIFMVSALFLLYQVLPAYQV